MDNNNNNIDTANRIDKDSLKRGIKFLLSLIIDDRIIIDMYKGQEEHIKKYKYTKHNMPFTNSIIKVNSLVNNCIVELAEEREEGKLLEDIDYYVSNNKDVE